MDFSNISDMQHCLVITKAVVDYVPTVDNSEVNE